MIGHTTHSIPTVRSFESMAHGKHCWGGKDSLMVRLVEEITEGFHPLCVPKLWRFFEFEI